MCTRSYSKFYFQNDTADITRLFIIELFQNFLVQNLTKNKYILLKITKSRQNIWRFINKCSYYSLIPE